MTLKNIILGALVLAVAGCGLRSDNQTDKKSRQGEPADRITQGMVLLSRKQYPEAINAFNLAIKEDPQNVENYLILGQVYNKLGNYAGAEGVLTAAQQLDPKNGEIYFQLSQALGRQEGKISQSLAAALLSYQNFSASQDEEGAKKSLILIKALSDGVKRAQVVDN